MEKYEDNDRNSGVAAYEIGHDLVRVKFRDGAIYLYTYASAGSHHVEQMKILAARGDGLNAYITKYVRRGYERREH